MTLTIECRCGYCSDIDTLNPHPRTCPKCGGDLFLSGTDTPLYVGRELNPSLFDDEDYGMLTDYHTGEEIGLATLEQRNASRAAGSEGVILVDADGVVLREDDRGADNARRCYVQE